MIDRLENLIDWWNDEFIEWCLKIVRGIENETAEDFNEGKTNKNSFWEPNQHLFIYCNQFFFNHLISLLVNSIWKILSFVVLSKCIKLNCRENIFLQYVHLNVCVYAERLTIKYLLVLYAKFIVYHLYW